MLISVAALAFAVAGTMALRPTYEAYRWDCLKVGDTFTGFHCISFEREEAPPPVDGKVLDLPPITEVVPDGKTAITIAVAVLVPLYGSKTIRSEAPFQATLQDTTWTVVGRLPPASIWSTTLGGVANVQIDRRDGRIIKVWHTM
jgi:hypothetical protein